LARQQADALSVALESNRQLGSELDRLKKAGIDLAGGASLDPQKVITEIMSGKRIDAPDLAGDMLAMVTREDPNGGKILAQSWMDYVTGVGTDMKPGQMLSRLQKSKAVGEIWAGKEKVSNFEQVIRSVADKTAKDHSFAKHVLSPALGMAGAGMTAAGAGGVPSSMGHGLAIAGAFMASAAVPHIFTRVRDKYGQEGLDILTRELLMDRSKYLRAEKIARGVPRASDFEWVDTQVRGLMLRQAGRLNRQTQTSGEPQ
jgi:hypothetical protein